jgi:hypothetical protein
MKLSTKAVSSIQNGLFQKNWSVGTNSLRMRFRERVCQKLSQTAFNSLRSWELEFCNSYQILTTNMHRTDLLKQTFLPLLIFNKKYISIVYHYMKTMAMCFVKKILHLILHSAFNFVFSKSYFRFSEESNKLTFEFFVEVKINICQASFIEVDERKFLLNHVFQTINKHGWIQKIN